MKITGSLSWDASVYYQGDSGTVTFTLYNDNPLVQWYIKKVGIQFDWMQGGQAYLKDVGQNIASGSSASYSVLFSIGSLVTVGQHSFNIIYVGAFDDTHVIGSGSIYIHDAYEKVYRGAVDSVYQKIVADANFKSPNAQSLYKQALDAYNQAATLANQGLWRDANDKLTSASSLLSQAEAAESSYTPPILGGGSSQNPGGLSNEAIILISAVIAIGIVLAVLVVRKRGGKRED